MEKNVAYCQLIAKLIEADSEVHEIEKAWLERTMDRLELTKAQRKTALDTSDTSEAEETIRGLPEEERQELKDELVAAALLDGTISTDEAKLLAELKKQLDL